MTAFSGAAAISGAHTSRGDFAPNGTPTLSEIAPERCGYVPSDAYEYDEFPELAIPQIAPPPSGGVSLEGALWMAFLALMGAGWGWAVWAVVEAVR